MPAALFSQLAGWASRWPALAKLAKKPSVSSALGLDIGSTSVKAALLSQTPSGPRLERSAVVPLPAGAGKPEVVKAVQQALQKAAAPRDVRVVSAVGGAGTVVRAVDFPKMSPHEMRNALAFEAEKHIPFKMDGVYLDFSILGEKPGGQMEILLAAARKEIVAEHLEILSQAGVSPHSVDIEMLALANSWEGGRAPKEGVVGLIHVGARATLLDFMRGARLQFAREIPLSGALQPPWDEWLNRCRTSFDFYENQQGVRVERLVLSGGAASEPGFKEWVQEASGLPTELWSAEGAVPGTAELSLAFGLAVREMAA